MQSPIRRESMMNCLVLAGFVGLLAATSYGVEQPPGGAGAEVGSRPGGTVLAWIRFDDAEHRYADIPYLWLGHGDLRFVIDVPPQQSHRLELLWGSKDDAREAFVTVNGHRQTIREGGYDGFRWVPIPQPPNVSGKSYEVTLQQASANPAFVAAVRMTDPNKAEERTAQGLEASAHKIVLEKLPQSGTEAFPEMRAVWDREPPPRSNPSIESKQEAAFRKAERNARQANEQFFRCRRFVDGWLAYADPKTGLIPRNLNRDRDIWNANDSAADNYPFMVLTCAITDVPMFQGRMLDMLHMETRLTNRLDRLPDTWSFSKQGFQQEEPNLERIIFGGSEYVKDGLMPLTEWLGPSPWRERMLGILDDLWKHAPVETPFGNITSTNVEVNGEMLQVLSRAYWMTGDEKYLEYATRLGNYYLLGDHHPTRDSESLKLLAHGGEVVSGLCEFYAMIHFAAPEKKKAYYEPIHTMCDRILEVGRNDHGMIYVSINPHSGEHHAAICDTWGYTYDAYYTVYLIDKTEAYRQAVLKVLNSLNEHYRDPKWVDRTADGYADAVEGAINLYSREPMPTVAEWIDGQIKLMWRSQQPDGVIEGWHGDGNSARTGIMYALWKTKGLTVQPWRTDVRFGSVQKGDKVYVSLVAEQPWKGKLVFDRPRHKDFMHLPLDYPRLNQFPEWFTVEAEKRYTVRDVAAGTERTFGGKDLQTGIPLTLEPGTESRLIVTTVP